MSWVSTGELPGPDEIERTLEEAHRSFLACDDGEVADYIPALSSVSPDLFGICLAGVSGRMYAIGDSDVPFTIQSVSNPSSSPWSVTLSAPTRHGPRWA